MERHHPIPCVVFLALIGLVDCTQEHCAGLECQFPHSSVDAVRNEAELQGNDLLQVEHEEVQGLSMLQISGVQHVFQDLQRKDNTTTKEQKKIARKADSLEAMSKRRREIPITVPVVYSQAKGTGGSECPCITNASASWPTLQAFLASQKLPSYYGTGGCDTYDWNNSEIGCGSNSLPFCYNSWCFVDPDVCPVNATLCKEANFKVGSDNSPYCRDRPHVSKEFPGGKVMYSYETCGSLNTYDESIHQESVAGTMLKVAIAEDSSIWLSVKNGPSGQKIYSGVLYDFFIHSLALYEPKVTMQVMPVYATNESKRIIPWNDHTACVHDVAVGNVDVCVADVWHTPSRSRMAEFSPTLKIDNLVLVVPVELHQESFLTRLSKPFKPFTLDAWVLLLMLIAAMTVVRWLMTVCAPDRKEEDAGFLNNVKELNDSAFAMMDDFLSQATTADDKSAYLLVFRLVFSFFVLVIMASYTASLASMLVVQRQAEPGIPDIRAAIEMEARICVQDGISDAMSRMFPQGDFKGVSATDESPRKIYSGICDAAVMTEDHIHKMQSGLIHQADCELVRTGKLTEEEGRCQKGWKNAERDDCALQQVGDVLLSVPVAFPVNSKLAHSLSWAFSTQWSAGKFEEVMKENKEAYREPICKSQLQRDAETDGLDSFDLGGTFIISFLILFAGIVAFTCNLCRTRA